MMHHLRRKDAPRTMGKVLPSIAQGVQRVNFYEINEINMGKGNLGLVLATEQPSL